MANVVVIDDEEAVRRSLLNMLEQKGHNVLLAPNGVAGLQQCQDNDVDLAIVDIFMPEKDGLEVIRTLKLQHESIKVMAITGGGSLEINFLPEARALGAEQTLRKPFTANELYATLDVLLGA